MKFLKRSTSPRPTRREEATDKKHSDPSKMVPDKSSLAAGDGVGNGSHGGSGSSSSSRGGSWERWRPLVVSRGARADSSMSAAASAAASNGPSVRHADAGLSNDGGLPLATSSAAGQDEAGSVASNGSHRSSGTASSGGAAQRRRRRRPRRRRMLATVRIVKGPDGFGFTVITARHGQKVNSIIEEERCNGLLRGDLLLSIDGKELAGLSHDEVVQLLRRRAEGAEATIVVRRRDPADTSRQPQQQDRRDSDRIGGMEFVRDRRAEELDKDDDDRHAAVQLADAAAAHSLERPPPVPPRYYKASKRFSTLPLPVHAAATDSAADFVGMDAWAAQRQANTNGRMPSTSTTSTSHSSLPGRSVELRWRQPPQPPEEQQQQRQQKPVPQVTTLAALQHKYFRQWQAQHGLPQSGRRPATADGGARAPETAGGMEAHRHELAPRLPPRPQRQAGTRPPQQPEQQVGPAGTDGVLVAGKATAPVGPLVTRSASAAAAAAVAASTRPQHQQQQRSTAEPATRSRSASPDGPRDRHLRLLRSLAFSAPSLPESTRRLAGEQQRPQAGSVPHFATMARRPKKPDGLRLAIAGSGGGSDGAATTARWPSAVSSWDRLARSRTPDGTASFWQQARPNEHLVGGAGGAAQARPASSADGLLRRSTPGGRLESTVQQQQQHNGNGGGAGGKGSGSGGSAATRSSTALLSPRPQLPAASAVAAITSAEPAAVAGLGRSASMPAIRGLELPSAAATAAAAAAAAQGGKSDGGNGAGGAAAPLGSGSTTTLLRAWAPAGRDRPGEMAAPSITALGKYQVVELDLTLYRQEGGFGFCLVGGPEGGTQVTVGRLAPGGSADLDGSLRTGDEIVAVDGVPAAGASHYRVVQLMGGAASRGKVDLRVRRRLLIQAAHQPAWADTSDRVDVQPPPTSPTQHAPYTVAAQWQPAAAVQRVMPVAVPADDLLQVSSCSITLTQQPADDGFGILIMTPRQQPHERLAEVKIGQILPSSPAARCGRLFVGDRILAINGMAVSGMPHDAIVSLIKERGRLVTIAVATGQQQQHQDVSGGGGHTGAAGHHDIPGGHVPQGSFDAIGEELNGSLARQDSFLEVSAVPCVGQSCPDTPEQSAASALRKREGRVRLPSYQTDQAADKMVAYPSSRLAMQQKPALHQQDARGGIGSSVASSGGNAWGSQRIGGSYCQLDVTDDGAVRSPLINDAAGSHGPMTYPGFSKSTTLPGHSAAAAVVAASSAMAKATHRPGTQQPSVVTVELLQDNRGFGFSVRGGHEFGSMPLCVLRLAPGGAAENSGKLQVGDEILEINGYRTVGMRHADAIALIQDAGPSVRLTLRRSNASTSTDPPVPVASGEAGSPRSSPTGSSANGSNGGMNGEKWWSHNGQTPPAATAEVGSVSYFSPPQQQQQQGVLPASAERSKSTSSAGLREFGGSGFGASVAPNPAHQRPSKPNGPGLLMHAPRWQQLSHHTLPSSPQHQLQLSPTEEPADDVFQRRVSSGTGVPSSPQAVLDDTRGSRSYLTPAGGYSGGGAAEGRQMRTAATSGSNGPRPTSGYLSPGVTGTSRFSADFESPRVAGEWLSVTDAAAMGRLAAVAPFGFYETLLRHVPST